MNGYGQFCAIARAHDAIGGRWTLLVVRELLCGSRRFSQIRRGIPRISPTVLSDRLEMLVAIGAVCRSSADRPFSYRLTDSGLELSDVLGALASWGQRWLPRDTVNEDIDPEPLLFDMRRRVRQAAIPATPFVIRFEIGRFRPWFMLLKSADNALCDHNPGFPEAVVVRTPLPVLAAWWRGDIEFGTALRRGLALEGPRDTTRRFPHWFSRYMFADTSPARSEAGD